MKLEDLNRKGTFTQQRTISMKNPALRPTEHGEDDKYIVKSWGVTSKEIKASTEIAVPDAVNMALKVDFQFEGGNQQLRYSCTSSDISAFPRMSASSTCSCPGLISSKGNTSSLK
jgi:hypothetical protein